MRNINKRDIKGRCWMIRDCDEGREQEWMVKGKRNRVGDGRFVEVEVEYN